MRRSASSTRTLGDTLSDVYMGVLAAAMSIAIALHAAATYIPAHSDPGAAGTGGFAVTGADRIAGSWPMLLALAALAVGTLVAARRLGPVGLDGPRARWWFPLPVDRVGLIGPSAWKWPAVGGALGATLGALAVAVLGTQDGAAGPGEVVAGACAAGLTIAALAVALVLAQSAPVTAPDGDSPTARGFATSPDDDARTAGGAVTTRTGTPARAGDVGTVRATVPEPDPSPGGDRGALEATLLVAGSLVAAGAVAVLVLAPPAPAVPPAGALWAVAGIALAGLALAVVAARRAIPRIPDAEIARGGSVAGAATGAVSQLDTRSLGSLMRTGSRPVIRRPARLRLLARLPLPWRAPVALVVADLVATRRSPGRALRPLLAALAIAVVAGTVGLPAWLLAVAIGIGGYVSARAGAEGARTARVETGLDAHLPMSARAHRLCRLATSWLLMLPYSVGVAIVLGGPTWFVLLALSGIGWAAAALRWAYRKDDEGTGLVAPSAFGPIPIGSILLLLTGPDVAVVASVTIGLAIWAGSPILVLLAATAGLGAVLAAVVTTPPPAYEA
ncbi:hypothetical protein CZ771_14170 [Actinomycetales bacterium JB111]|nr:hypothetical protein CZ771_14170 [Actinomycetales bacterium JB111]